MLQEILFVVLTIIVVFDFLKVHILPYIKEKKRKRRAHKKNPRTILNRAIDNFTYIYRVTGAEKQFCIGSEYPVDRQIDIDDGIDKMFKILAEDSSQKVNYQSFFDQLLKFRAELLHEIYKKEEKMRKDYQRKGEEIDSLNREEIEKFLEESKKLQTKKGVAEDEFWGLHDALKEWGFSVWGDESYKVYLVLKPVFSFFRK